MPVFAGKTQANSTVGIWLIILVGLFFTPVSVLAQGAAGAAAPAGGGGAAPVSGAGISGASGPAAGGGGTGAGIGTGRAVGTGGGITTPAPALGTGQSPSGPLGKAGPPMHMGSGLTRAEPINGTIVPNANVGYLGQFSPNSAPPWAVNNPLNLNAPFQPSFGPAALGMNSQPALLPPPMMTMPTPTNPLAECIQGFANAVTAQSQMSQMQMMLDDANEKMGPRKHPSFNKRANREILRGFSKSEGNCQKFIDNNGNLGPWGHTLLDCMHWDNNRDVYGYPSTSGAPAKGVEPSDVYRYCPSFGKMDQARRDRFWVWFFMSVAGPESSCNPGILGKGLPGHGPAIGLFQLEADKC